MQMLKTVDRSAQISKAVYIDWIVLFLEGCEMEMCVGPG